MPTAHGPRRDFTAAVAPTTAEDLAAGYRLGDRWLDTSAGALYVLQVASSGTWLAVSGGGGGGGGAPTGAQYLTLATDATLTAERTLALTSGQLTGADGGAGGAYTVSIAPNPTIPGTAGMVLPIGTTAQRGAATAGKLRASTTLGQLEWADGSGWQAVPLASDVTGATTAAGVYARRLAAVGGL